MTMTELLLTAMATDDPQGATDQELDDAAAALGIELPEDYRAVMRRVNGGECDFGESWIVFQSLEASIERNATFKEAGFPPFIFFGSDGGGDGYAWDLRPERHSRYVVVPFVVPGDEAVIPCGDTLEEFLSVLHGGIRLERRGD
jgi:cell wall assembly regulator SMI1